MAKSDRLRLDDVRDVFRLLNEIRELRGDRSAWQRHMVLGLCEMLRARQGTALEFAGFEKAGAVKLREFLHAGHATETCQVLWDHVRKAEGWRGDPILNRATDIEGAAHTFTRQQLVPSAEWYQSKCCQEFCRPAEIDQVLVSWFHLPQRGVVRAFSFQRAWGEKPFDERAAKIMRLFNLEYRDLYLAGKLDPLELFGPSGKRLSPRQRDVLRGLLAGNSVKQVARHLDLSPRTVEDYVKTLHRLYGVHSRAELLAKFLHFPQEPNSSSKADAQ